MNNVAAFDAQRAGELLTALGEQLRAERTRIQLVVIGGSALQALGLVERLTSDVDIVALADGTKLMTRIPCRLS